MKKSKPVGDPESPLGMDHSHLLNPTPLHHLPILMHNICTMPLVPSTTYLTPKPHLSLNSSMATASNGVSLLQTSTSPARRSHALLKKRWHLLTLQNGWLPAKTNCDLYRNSGSSDSYL